MSKHAPESFEQNARASGSTANAWQDEARSLAYEGHGAAAKAYANEASKDSSDTNPANKLVYGLQVGVGIGAVIATRNLSPFTRIPMAALGAFNVVWGGSHLAQSWNHHEDKNES